MNNERMDRFFLRIIPSLFLHSVLMSFQDLSGNHDSLNFGSTLSDGA